ncbi:P-loop containing nucleoside triphosphate hydrolase protein [Venturia nashicola]|uniref:P-loop containing nucleoside triphosphate hydrolase protein n=1 Tax=Venturia nashicola TaxID=86259 RepID=A0A4Z1NMG8_9PEZI|nr:P-loop containing nucleoside triphosphate hydrolase protein [Venturia nashicola]
MAQAHFDVYASSFVPQWLKDISEAPAHLVFATAPTDFDVRFGEYTGTFAGRDLIGDGGLGLSLVGHNDDITTPPSIGRAMHVLPQPTSYQRLFHKALVDEFRALEISQKRYNLSRVFLNSVDMDRSGGSYVTAHLSVPGVRENSPFVRLGDVITIRPLLLDHSGQPVKFQQLSGQAAFYLPVPGWNRTEFQATVSGVNRTFEVLSMKIDNPAAFEPYSRGPINVSFPIRANWATSQYISVQTAQGLINANDVQEKWTRQMLFPEPTDGRVQRTLNPAKFKINQVNRLLNFEQTKAVNAVLENNYGNIPFLISGPPGTGKTMTTVEAALQLVLNKKSQHILVCAPSDPAADTLAQRLKDYLKHPTELFRMNGPTRTFAEVPESLMAFSYVENNCFGLPPFKVLMNFKVIVTTCRDADMLVRARLTNRDLCELEQNLQSILHPEDRPEFRPLHWDAMFLDEAAQATEPEALIPLTVVAPPKNYPGPHLPQVIMAGDHRQLGPRTASVVGIIKTSLFERLLERQTYSHHPLSRSRKPRTGLTKAMLPIYRPPFADLIRNYRSHPAILAIPNSLFYHDTLLPESHTTHLLQSFAGWQNTTFPVQFVCNRGSDEQEQEHGGWYNVSEQYKALAHAASFLRSGLIDQRDICVMAPFAAQVRHLRNLFRTHGMADVNIGPMEAFQGLESRLVILCTTRSRKRFLDMDKERGLGVVHEAKRFNVALTRAKQGLIVIGNPKLLACDPHWDAFMEFCRRNGCWETDDLPAGVGGERGGQWDSRPLREVPKYNLPVLERISLHGGVEEEEGRQLGSVMYRDDAMWAAGIHDALPNEEDDEEVEGEDEQGLADAGYDGEYNEEEEDVEFDDLPQGYSDHVSDVKKEEIDALIVKTPSNKKTKQSPPTTTPTTKKTNPNREKEVRSTQSNVTMPPKPSSFTSPSTKKEQERKQAPTNSQNLSSNKAAKPTWANVAKLTPAIPKKIGCGEE